MKNRKERLDLVNQKGKTPNLSLSRSIQQRTCTAAVSAQKKHGHNAKPHMAATGFSWYVTKSCFKRGSRCLWTKRKIELFITASGKIEENTRPDGHGPADRDYAATRIWPLQPVCVGVKRHNARCALRAIKGRLPHP